MAQSLLTSDDLSLVGRSPKFIFGLDEVGRGCVAGPVVGACFAYEVSALSHLVETPTRIFDSKKLSASQRTRATEWTKSFFSPKNYSLHAIDNLQIDTSDILTCSLKVMAKAFHSVKKKLCVADDDDYLVLVDGNQRPRDIPADRVLMIPQGDSKSFAIAMASILAKVNRDQYMHEQSLKYPGYSWETNVGYLTADHKSAIAKLGFTPLHRRSFNVQV